MIVRYGLEVSEDLTEDIDFLSSLPIQFEYEDTLFITKTEQDAEIIKEYLVTTDQYVDDYRVIQLISPVVTPLFEDYGFVLNDTNYMILDSIAIFYITHGEEKQVEMALYQIEECLIATETIEQVHYYIIDQHQKELIEGFASAYEIQLCFLDLDKCLEND